MYKGRQSWSWVQVGWVEQVTRRPKRRLMEHVSCRRRTRRNCGRIGGRERGAYSPPMTAMHLG